MFSDEQLPKPSKLNVKMETEFAMTGGETEGERAGPMGSPQETGAEWMGGSHVENWYEAGRETEDPAWGPPLPSSRGTPLSLPTVLGKTV